MNIVCGVDLVYLPRFKKSLKRGGENFLRRVYRNSELTNNDPVHLAGIFAAKESVIKALDLPVDSWLNIKIVKNSKGRPGVQLSTLNSQLSTYSLSISHDSNYVIAQFVAMLKK